MEGKVEQAVKGGYEVRIARQRAFCPFSQIDIVRTDPSAHEGQVYAFRIIEYKEGGRNLVVSRRALLEEEQRANAAEVRRSIVAGAVITGRVASVREFGAFVDLGGGVQGLLHVSEMGWSRVSDPSQVVKPGEEITVKVLRVDDDTAEDLPRVEAAHRRSVVESPGHLRDRPGASPAASRVSRSSGRSSSSSRGVEGLAHVSTFAPTGRSEGWSTMVALGTTAAFEILSIDLEKKRIGVALVPEGSTRAGGTRGHRHMQAETEDGRESTEREDVAPAEGFGSLADKLRGALKPREK